MTDEQQKLARLQVLRKEAAAIELELGIESSMPGTKTFGFSREEANAMALPTGMPDSMDAAPFYTLDDQDGVVRDEAAPMDGPLKGIKVLDLTRILAGPHCCKMLADLGATVTMVEHPQAEMGATGGTRPNAHYFASTSAGKEESILADLQSDDGIALLHELIVGADVLVENYRPGVMDRLGLGWEALHAMYCNLQ